MTLTAVVLAAVAVGAADVATFKLLSRYFDGRAAASVRQIAQTATAATGANRRLSVDLFAQTDRPVLVELRSPAGRVLERIGAARSDKPFLASGALAHPNHALQVEGGEGPAYEVIAVHDARGRVVVAAVSLASEVTTLHHLFAFNFKVGAVVLVLLGLVATVLLTRSLRPLRRIASTADAIAAGNLAERVPAASPNSEIGRVSTAINRMLEEIEAAFAQRDATEQRLRQFLADASHELRTPLTSIRGYAELFRRGADRRPADLAQAMHAIESEAERMSALVDDLLLLARLDDARPLEREPVELDTVVEEAVGAARVVDPTRRFGFELAERPLLVTGDALRLRQVLDNLLANVRQHTPPGTSAYVTARRGRGEAVVTVEDDGPGIPAGERARVFDRFFRPHDGRDRDRGGAGLGLAIVSSIAAAHGGRVELREAHPHGAVFELRLPLADSRPTPSGHPGSAEPELVHSVADTHSSRRPIR